MKKHYFFDGKEVFLGDTIVLEKKGPHIKEHLSFKLSEDILEALIKYNKIEVKEGEDNVTKETHKNSFDVGFDEDMHYKIFNNAIDSLAARLAWNPKKLINYIYNLTCINPSVAFSLMLKEIAVELDKKYKDHISKSEEIYIIDVTNGKICKLSNVKKVKNFRNFAAFRNIEDAKIACHILKNYLKYMYK